MDLRSLISSLETAIGDPRAGLPNDVFLFISRLTPLINVDLLIKDDRGRTLLTWRADEFYGPGWHVPGSIIRYKEAAADRIHACAQDELGANVSFDPVPILLSESIEPQKDRGHFISMLFRCRLTSPVDEARRASSDPPQPGGWRWHDRAPADLLTVHRHYARFM